MSHYRRANIPGATYFFTVVTYRRRSIFCDAPVRAALRDAIKTVQSRHPFTIDAWVLLPDHLRCVWTLPPGDAHYALRWGLIKRMVSYKCAQHYHRTDWMTASKIKHRESTFWQRRYWEHCITTETDYSNHMDYIAINPVKHGLVTRVRDWPYSTFHRDVARGIYPLDWAGTPDILDLAFGGEPVWAHTFRAHAEKCGDACGGQNCLSTSAAHTTEQWHDYAPSCSCNIRNGHLV